METQYFNPQFVIVVSILKHENEETLFQLSEIVIELWNPHPVGLASKWFSCDYF